MKTCRRLWTLAVLATVVVSLVAGGMRLGWMSVGLAAASLAGFGVIFGLALAPVGQRRRVVLRTTTWCAIGGVLMVGMPVVLGPWSVLVRSGWREPQER